MKMVVGCQYKYIFHYDIKCQKKRNRPHKNSCEIRHSHKKKWRLFGSDRKIRLGRKRTKLFFSSLHFAKHFALFRRALKKLGQVDDERRRSRFFFCTFPLVCAKLSLMLNFISVFPFSSLSTFFLTFLTEQLMHDGSAGKSFQREMEEK